MSKCLSNKCGHFQLFFKFCASLLAPARDSIRLSTCFFVSSSSFLLFRISSICLRIESSSESIRFWTFSVNSSTESPVILNHIRVHSPPPLGRTNLYRTKWGWGEYPAPAKQEANAKWHLRACPREVY